ncbi:MAG: PorV/PorQ family protein [bacterium]
MRKAAFIFVVMLITAPPGFSDAGTSSLAFLKIGIDARSSSMAGAFSAISDDANILRYNPAGLAGLNNIQASFSHNSWVEGITINSLNSVLPLEGGKSFGLGILSLNAGTMEGREDFDQKIDDFKASDFLLTGIFSWRINKAFYGAAIKYIQEEIEDTKAKTPAVDFGAIYGIGGKTDAGFAVQNLGPGVKYIEKKEKLPLLVRAGISRRLLNGNMLLNIDAVGDIEKNIHLKIGGEFKTGKMLDFRAGYKFTEKSGLGGLAGMSAGFGIKYSRFGFDYAFVPYGDLGQTHQFSMSVKSGLKKRKSKKPAGEVVLDPEIEKLYQELFRKEKTLSPEEKKAMMQEYLSRGTDFYKQGKYREAIIEWEKFLELDPEQKSFRQKVEKIKEKLREEE